MALQENAAPYVIRILQWLKTPAHAWTVVLTVGALIVISYSATVGFMPELDFQASATILATCAATGVALVLALLVLLLLPAVLWKSFAAGSTALKPLWTATTPNAEAPAAEAPDTKWLAAGFAFPVLVALTWASAGLWHPSVLKDSRYFGLLAFPLLAAGIRSRSRPASFVDHVVRILWYGALSLLVVVEFTIPTVAILGLLRLSPTTEPEAVKLLLSAMLGLLFVNTLTVLVPNKPELLDVYAALALLLLCLTFTFTHSWSFIPSRVMQVYSLGNMKGVTLVLDRQGCSIARLLDASLVPAVKDDSTKPKAAPDSACKLAQVDVAMRLGSQFLVAIPNKGDTTRFVLSRDRVLSWTLPKLPTATDSPARGQKRGT